MALRTKKRNRKYMLKISSFIENYVCQFYYLLILLRVELLIILKK